MPASKLFPVANAALSAARTWSEMAQNSFEWASPKRLGLAGFCLLPPWKRDEYFFELKSKVQALEGLKLYLGALYIIHTHTHTEGTTGFAERKTWPRIKLLLHDKEETLSTFSMKNQTDFFIRSLLKQCLNFILQQNDREQQAKNLLRLSGQVYFTYDHCSPVPQPEVILSWPEPELWILGDVLVVHGDMSSVTQLAGWASLGTPKFLGKIVVRSLFSCGICMKRKMS